MPIHLIIIWDSQQSAWIQHNVRTTPINLPKSLEMLQSQVSVWTLLALSAINSKSALLNSNHSGTGDPGDIIGCSNQTVPRYVTSVARRSDSKVDAKLAKPMQLVISERVDSIKLQLVSIPFSWHGATSQQRLGEGWKAVAKVMSLGLMPVTLFLWVLRVLFDSKRIAAVECLCFKPLFELDSCPSAHKSIWKRFCYCHSFTFWVTESLQSLPEQGLLLTFNQDKTEEFE